MADGEEVSVETKLKIAANFILKAPFGEVGLSWGLPQCAQSDEALNAGLFIKRATSVGAGNLCDGAYVAETETYTCAVE